VLFAVLAVTGMQIGKAAGLYVEDVDLHSQMVHVRRSIWKGEDLARKTENAIRQVDIDERSPRCFGSSPESGEKADVRGHHVLDLVIHTSGPSVGPLAMIHSLCIEAM
jgi:hypothetical protein